MSKYIHHELWDEITNPFSIYGAVYIYLTHLSYDDCENTCTFSYSILSYHYHHHYHHHHHHLHHHHHRHHHIIINNKSEVWPICHCLGLGHQTMVCAVCLSIFVYTITHWPQAVLHEALASLASHKSKCKTRANGIHWAGKSLSLIYGKLFPYCSRKVILKA